MERIVDSIERYAEAGATHLQLATPPGPETEDILEQLDLFVREILPGCHGEGITGVSYREIFLRVVQPGPVGR